MRMSIELSGNQFVSGIIVAEDLVIPVSFRCHHGGADLAEAHAMAPAGAAEDDVVPIEGHGKGGAVQVRFGEIPPDHQFLPHFHRQLGADNPEALDPPGGAALQRDERLERSDVMAAPAGNPLRQHGDRDALLPAEEMLGFQVVIVQHLRKDGPVAGIAEGVGGPVDPFRRRILPRQIGQTGMSDYDREQRKAYLDGIWQYWLKEIGESRKVSPEQLNQLANDSIMMMAATQDYVASKLIDKVMFPEEIKAEIKNRLKLDKDDDIHQLTLSNMLNVKSDKKDDGEKIAVYYAYGNIVDTESMNLIMGGGHSIVGKKTAEDLRKLADDDDVKAVVFRVNSGGGSAVASEQIRHAIKLIKAKKPVVVSMGGLAASGGYWISSPANYIFAEPTTITGSIGIFGLIPNFSGLVQDKLGITFDGVTTNKYTDFENDLILGKDNAETMKFMQTHVDRGYQQFLDIVSEGRGMKPAQVDSIAQGRVWLATDALKIKLVDKLGSIDDAVKKAAELAKLDEYYTQAYPGKGNWMDTFMPKEDKGSYLDSKFQAELKSLLGELYEPLMEIRNDIKNNSRIQARMLDDVRIK